MNNYNVSGVLFALLMLLSGMSLADGLILDNRHGDGGSAWGKDKCVACHVVQRIHRSKQASNIRSIVQKKKYASCMGCHGDNGTGRSRPCEICHNASTLPDTPHRNGAFKHEFLKSTEDEKCVICHDNSDMNGIFEVRQDLTLLPDKQQRLSPYFSGADFCLRCHNRDHQFSEATIENKHWRDPLIAMEDNYNFIDYHGKRKGGDGTYSGLRAGYKYSSSVECTDCHAMHGTDNDSLIIDNSAKGVAKLKLPKGFSQVPVWVGDGEFAQLCVLCHNMEQEGQGSKIDTGNGLSGVHQAWGNCRDCHAHGLASQAGF